MWTIDDFKDMEPEKYFDTPCPKTDSAKQKKADILNNKDNKYIATEKNDGCWSMVIHKAAHDNLIRSRSISKVTKQYGDFTEQVPHIANEANFLPDNTCVLGEICWNERGKTSNDVDVILHCLPDKAQERQKAIGKLHLVIFDCLMLNGQSMEHVGYFDRLQLIKNYLFEHDLFSYIHITKIFSDNFVEEAEHIWDTGGEGIVIQEKDGLYSPGKRTAWKTLKYKQTLSSMELLVTNVFDANKEYEGKELSTWKYFDSEGNPVTKAYYYGWKTAIEVNFNGVSCKVSSGLTELDQQWLSTPKAQELIAEGQVYAEIKAMMINARDSLRHPSVIRIRTDVVM